MIYKNRKERRAGFKKNKKNMKELKTWQDYNSALFITKKPFIKPQEEHVRQ